MYYSKITRDKLLLSYNSNSKVFIASAKLALAL